MLIDDLLELQKLFSDPKRWTQQSYARDKGGETVDALDPTATCWCVIGGAMKVTGERGPNLANLASVAKGSPKRAALLGSLYKAKQSLCEEGLEVALKYHEGLSLAGINDQLGLGEVQRIIARAISKEREAV